MLNAARIAEETMTPEQAPQTVNTDQKIIRPGVQERIAQALVATRNSQTQRMAKDNLDICLIRLAKLYDMDGNDAKILLKNLCKKNPQDLKVIYAQIVKDARKKVYTGWAIFSVFNLILIPMSVAYGLPFLILSILTFSIFPILYDTNRGAGNFLIHANNIKKIAGADYCPLESVNDD